jgi:GntR family transcriptional regulator/MocR family aminotransferase
MSTYRASGGTEPPRLVIGFGNTSQTSIRHGVQTIADLLDPKPTRATR